MESAQIGATTVPEIEIRPARRWGEFRLRELVEFRELLYFLFKRELQIRYKQSLLGILWVIIQPVGLAALFALVFGVLLNFPAPAGQPLVPFYLVVLVPWMLNAQAVILCANSLVGDASLLSKVYFPRLAIPIAKVAALLFDFVIAFAVSFVVAVLYGIALTASLLLIPIFLLFIVLTAFGLGCLLAALNVRYRDVAIATPLMVQAWLFISPILLQSSDVPGNWKYVYFINPMAGPLEGFRWAFLGQPDLDWSLMAISFASALALFVAGVLYFRRTEQTFADII